MEKVESDFYKLPTEEEIPKLTRAECIFFGLALLLKHAKANGETLEVYPRNDAIDAIATTPLSDEDWRLLEKLKWTDSPGGGYEIFT